TPPVRSLYAPGTTLDAAGSHRALALSRGGPMTAHPDRDARETLAERLVDATTNALETLGVYLGLELGLYRALADLGAATDAEVAAHAGIAPRYPHYWLGPQGVAGSPARAEPAPPA